MSSQSQKKLEISKWQVDEWEGECSSVRGLGGRGEMSLVPDSDGTKIARYSHIARKVGLDPGTSRGSTCGRCSPIFVSIESNAMNRLGQNVLEKDITGRVCLPAIRSILFTTLAGQVETNFG